MTTCILNEKPDISYPCPWQFKIVGTDKEAMLLAINGVISTAEHIITPSKKSSGGKYLSLNLEMVVESEEIRNTIFTNLCAQAAIRMVI